MYDLNTLETVIEFNKYCLFLFLLKYSIGFPFRMDCRTNVALQTLRTWQFRFVD